MSTKTTSGDATECFSADVVAPADDYMVDVEFLNTITLPNFPSHSLKLKKYMPLMLLRNLSPPDGLCNGTRLILLEVINGRLLKCEIATGKCRGNVVLIPRIDLEPDEGTFPFSWSRPSSRHCIAPRTRGIILLPLCHCYSILNRCASPSL